MIHRILEINVVYNWHMNCSDTMWKRGGVRVLDQPGVPPKFPKSFGIGFAALLCSSAWAALSGGSGRSEFRRRVLGQQPIDVIVGERLEALRTSRGVTLDQLGSVLGITGNGVANYEAGAVRVPPQHLIEICRFFQLSLQTLFPSLDRDHDPNLH